jgi:hypothetical protein
MALADPCPFRLPQEQLDWLDTLCVGPVATRSQALRDVLAKAMATDLRRRRAAARRQQQYDEILKEADVPALLGGRTVDQHIALADASPRGGRA